MSLEIIFNLVRNIKSYPRGWGSALRRDGGVRCGAASIRQGGEDVVWEACLGVFSHLGRAG